MSSAPKRRRAIARLAVLPLALAASVAIAAGGSAAGVHAAGPPRCDVNDEHLTYFPAGGAAGTLFEKFRIRHRGHGKRCTLRGYAKVTLIGKHGKVLAIKVHRDHSEDVETRVLKKHHPIYFFVKHPSAEPRSGKACSTKVYRFRVLLPGHSKSYTVKGFDPIKFCQKRARVTPFSPKASG